MDHLIKKPCCICSPNVEDKYTIELPCGHTCNLRDILRECRDMYFTTRCSSCFKQLGKNFIKENLICDKDYEMLERKFKAGNFIASGLFFIFFMVWIWIIVK